MRRRVLAQALAVGTTAAGRAPLPSWLAAAQQLRSVITVTLEHQLLIRDLDRAGGTSARDAAGAPAHHAPGASDSLSDEQVAALRDAVEEQGEYQELGEGPALNLAPPGQLPWQVLDRDDEDPDWDPVTWVATDLTRGRCAAPERNALLADEAKWEMYELSRTEPDYWTVEKLADFFQVRQQRVMAILALKDAEVAAMREGTLAPGSLMEIEQRRVQEALQAQEAARQPAGAEAAQATASTSAAAASSAGAGAAGAADSGQQAEGGAASSSAAADAPLATDGEAASAAEAQPSSSRERSGDGEADQAPLLPGLERGRPYWGDDAELAIIMENEVFECREIRGSGERHVKVLPSYPKFELRDPEGLGAAGHSSEVAQVEEALAAQEEAALVAEFRRDLAYNLRQTGEDIQRASLHGQPPARPEEGWSLVVKPLARGPDKPEPYVAQPDGTPRPLSDSEALYVERQKPRARRRLI